MTVTASMTAYPLADIHLKPDVLARLGLPDLAYPISLGNLNDPLDPDGELPLAVLLHGLQQRSREGGVDWLSLEAAMSRLAELLAPDDDRSVVTASGDTWWLELGPVDLDRTLVTIQRGDHLIAALTRRDDGRLRVATFRPLDARSAANLIALSQIAHPVHGVALRADNWAYALDCSASFGNYYAADAGAAYLSFWEHGLGLDSEGVEVPTWWSQRGAVARRPAVVATELGIHFVLSESADAGPAPASETASPPKAAAIPMWTPKRQQRRTVQGRFLGCLLGGAVGDALGAPVEFMKRAEIVRRFGPTGITQYAPAYGGLGTITDDTQMTLFTAEGLIRGWVRGCFKGITSYAGVTAQAYIRWLHTQGERTVGGLGRDSADTGWLIEQRALHHRRAPGTTCLSALRAMPTYGEAARNDSKGCGGVMRVAPVGLFAWRLGQQRSPHLAFELATDLAALTHGHPTGSLTGGVLAVLILALTDGASLPEALSTAKAILRTQAAHDETLRAIEQAEELAESGLPHDEAIAQLGQGWVAEEALAISIYCARVARNFRHGVILAVNHDGDSDSTGSIVGNLLGAQHGAQAIPAAWLEPLELREVIAELAADLHAFKDWEIGAHGGDPALNERIWQKYPGD